MTEQRQGTDQQNWQATLNPRLVQQLHQVAGQPGLINMQPTRTFLARLEEMSPNWPLAAFLKQRWFNMEVDQVEQVPIVYVPPPPDPIPSADLGGQKYPNRANAVPSVQSTPASRQPSQPVELPKTALNSTSASSGSVIQRNPISPATESAPGPSAHPSPASWPIVAATKSGGSVSASKVASPIKPANDSNDSYRNRLTIPLNGRQVPVRPIKPLGRQRTFSGEPVVGSPLETDLIQPNGSNSLPIVQSGQVSTKVDQTAILPVIRATSSVTNDPAPTVLGQRLPRANRPPAVDQQLAQHVSHPEGPSVGLPSRHRAGRLRPAQPAVPQSSPAEPALEQPPQPAIDIEAIAATVQRQFIQRLTIERERRGMKLWP